MSAIAESRLSAAHGGAGTLQSWGRSVAAQENRRAAATTVLLNCLFKGILGSFISALVQTVPKDLFLKQESNSLGLRLPDLAKENTGRPVKFEFHMSSKKQ